MKKWKSIKFTIMSIIACMAFIAVCVIAFKMKNGSLNPVKEKTTLNSDVLEASFRDIGELATHEYDFTMLEQYENTKTLFGKNIGLTKKSFLYSYDGVVKAGVDFSQIKVKVNEEKKTITLTIPDAKVLSVEIKEDSFRMYDEKNNLFNPIKIEDMNEANRELKANAEEKALSGDLLKKAKENAGVLIENMVSEIAGISDYSVIIK